MWLVVCKGNDSSLGIHYSFLKDHCQLWITNEKRRYRNLATASTIVLKRKMISISPLAFSVLAETRHSSTAKIYQEVQKDARVIQEVSFHSKDKDISLAKALLYVATEDESFMAFNREMDAYAIQNERRSASLPPESLEWTCTEILPLAGKNMIEWMAELDVIAEGSRG